MAERYIPCSLDPVNNCPSSCLFHLASSNALDVTCTILGVSAEAWIAKANRLQQDDPESYKQHKEKLISQNPNFAVFCERNKTIPQ